MNDFYFEHAQGVLDLKSVERLRSVISGDYDQQLSDAGLACTNDVETGQRLVANYSGHSTEMGSKVHDLLIGQAPVELRISEVMREFITQKNLLEYIRNFLGKSFFYHFAPSTRCILPGNEFALVPAHCDFSYNSHFCDALDPTVQGKFFVAWIPLDVINEQRRGLEVYESEALTYEAESKTEDLWFVPIQTSTEPTSIYASPGDFIIFNPAAVHQSGGNVSSSRRVSMEVRFFPEDTLTSKHYFDPTSGILYEPDTGPNARNSM